MAARTRKIRQDANTRAKIQAAQIINRFMKCLNGEVELTTQQVSCGKALLAKVLPDLSSVEMTGELEHRMVEQYTDDELAIIAAGSRKGTTPPPLQPTKPDSIH